MAETKKVTISVPKDDVSTLERWKASGRIDNLSAYVSAALRDRMDRDISLDAIESSFGGVPPLELVNQARRVQGLPPLSAEDLDRRSAGAA
ncbi:hypothetical protein A5780_17305 [Nocardia sp. 852002-20019_SCH5090214]|jgi:hypothetical protein|uniref:CopG family transcriptional regulator n=6 Tax=Nocardia TaxID=1817 RepID=A0A231GYI3_9NOCA|nr:MULTISPECIES: hypothetical protein [Nocardia]OBF66842.1 hypothetical protein A9X06_05565 [Mycobacterium sp. 852002-51759_SCH5129042]MBF5002207.1 hypothetical protein [Nocardia sp. BSTN01]MBF6146358.1 hypothetical protein [Nocardia nova]MBF6276509.1 hypothetical protein [Nocardia nova]MBF6447662.1 hypothetical protein [Nocardia elegans]